MKLSIIIPTFNEAATITKVLDAVLKVDVGGWEKEIIVVDDGSTDATASMLSASSAVLVLSHETNQGKGAAIQTGLLHASGDYVLIQDADLEYEPSDISSLVSLIKGREAKQPIAVYGDRGIKAYPERGIHYVIGAKLLTWTVNILFGSHLKDLYTGYKLLPTGIIKELDIHSSGFEFEAEVTCKMIRRDVLILETPITYRPRNKEQGKKIRFMDAVKGFWIIIKLFFS